MERHDLVLPPDASGRQRHVRTLDEKLVHRCGTHLPALPAHPRACLRACMPACPPACLAWTHAPKQRAHQR